MKESIIGWFEKGGSEKLVKQLKSLVLKLSNFEKRVAAGKKTGFAPHSELREGDIPPTKPNTGGGRKELNQAFSRFTPPETKKFLKLGDGEKTLMGMALKHIPSIAKKFLRLNAGKKTSPRAAVRKTGLVPLGRGQAETKRVQAGPPSFMKGQFAQETQEQTAARYLREEEITQRGLGPDATEEERGAQQALERRQRASSAGEGFYSKPTFMKKKAPSLFHLRGVEDGASAESRKTSPVEKKADRKAETGSRAYQQFTRQINAMDIPSHAKNTILRVVTAPSGYAKGIPAKRVDESKGFDKGEDQIGAVFQRMRAPGDEAELKAAAGKETGFTPGGIGPAQAAFGQTSDPAKAAAIGEEVLASMGLSHLMKGPVVGPEPLTPAERASGMTLDAAEAAAKGEEVLASMGLTLEEALAGKGPGNASVIKDVPPGEDVRSHASNLFSLGKPEPKAAKEMMSKFVKTGLVSPGKQDVDTSQTMLKKGGVVPDQPFEGLRLPKETEKYTDFKEKFEKENNPNDKPGDEVEKDISELQEEGEKTTATLTKLEKKLTELEKKIPGERQNSNMTESQANRSAPESSTIDNFMNRANRVVWSPL